MIFVTGDTHGQLDIAKIQKRKWPQQFELSKSDYLIVLGDFGLFWKQDKTFEYLLDFYESRCYTVLWIDGNHENHNWIDSLPMSEWHGGLVHDFHGIIHLVRGQIYNIDGYKFFTLGGAKSIDRVYRQEGVSWWPQEELNFVEQEDAIKNLKSSKWCVDYILTHAAPRDVLRLMFPDMRYDGNSTTEKFLEYVHGELRNFTHWYFGHYHEDKDFYKFSAVYDRILKIGGKA